MRPHLLLLPWPLPKQQWATGVLSVLLLLLLLLALLLPRQWARGALRRGLASSGAGSRERPWAVLQVGEEAAEVGEVLVLEALSGAG
jgi:hypothetical protein